MERERQRNDRCLRLWLGRTEALPGTAAVAAVGRSLRWVHSTSGLLPTAGALSASTALGVWTEGLLKGGAAEPSARVLSLSLTPTLHPHSNTCYRERGGAAEMTELSPAAD